MQHLKTIAGVALGLVILGAIIVGFSMLGSELYRMLAQGTPGDGTAEAHSRTEPGERDPDEREGRRSPRGSGDRDPEELGDLEPIHVQVLMPDMSPAAGVEVMLAEAGHPPYEKIRTATTDADGLVVFADLARERYAVTSSVAPYVPMSNTHVFTGEKLTLELAEGASLRGRVTDESTGRGVEGVQIHGTTRDLAPVRWNELVETDAEGYYEFTAVPEVPLVVRYTRNLFHPHLEKDLLVGGAGREVDVRMKPGLVVTGWVTDADTGDPVPGASISYGFGIFQAEDVVDADDRGMFTLRGLQRSKLQIRAKADGYAPGRAQVDLRYAESETGVQIELVRWTTVAGTVRSLEGEPVEGAEVFLVEQALFFARSSKRLTVTDADGHFEARLENVTGDVRLGARHENFTEARSSSLRIRPGEHLDELEILLPVGGRIEGIVKNDKGAPVSGARITLYESRPANTNNPAYRADVAVQARPRGRVTNSAQSGADGKFSIRGIEPGMKFLEVRAGGFLAETREELMVEEGKVVGPLEIGLQHGRSIEGVVRDSAGKPVEGARVSVLRLKGQREGASGSATSDARGAFGIDNLGSGQYRVVVTRSGFVRQDREGVAADSEGLSFVLKRYGGIAGTVLFGAGKPPAKFQVQLRELGAGPDSPPASRKTFSSSKGKYRLDSVPPGSYELSVFAEGFLPTTLSSVSVSEGDVSDSVDVALDTGGVVEGIVLSDSGAPVRRADVYVRFQGGGDPSRTRRVTGPVRTDAYNLEMSYNLL